MNSIDFEDVQGVILRGYKELVCARFVMLTMRDAGAARNWLGDLSVTSAAERDHETAVNLAFTWEGLRALGVPDNELEQFVPELSEGMSKDAQRQRALGDIGKHAPEHWEWGGPNDVVHGALLLYADTQAKLDELEARLFEGRKTGVDARRLETRALLDPGTPERYWFREHFGFRDGIAQPSISANVAPRDQRGVLRPAGEANTIAAGEFLFGYANEYGKKPEGAPARIRDNGSFLVFRQIEQDVCGFWRFVRDRAKGLKVDPIWLAAKMVGRWPNGAPLVRAPHQETAGFEQFDSFGYAKLDPEGHACPFGAHIRRANPRDSLVPGERQSVAITKTHRLIRRGRSYGEPVHDPLDPSAFLAKIDQIATKPAPARGVHFLCFNASIRRQFEFVQQTWINSRKFMGQQDGPDPVTAPTDGGAFELPGLPARRRITDMTSFIRIRGGAYFFMPGLRALRSVLDQRP
ncbi:MAG: peroxidase [Polyangiaceae bacterium]